LIYRREPQQIIERVIEQPKKPPPRLVTKVINEPRGQPIVRTKCILVDPRPRVNEVQQTGSNFISLPTSRSINLSDQNRLLDYVVRNNIEPENQNASYPAPIRQPIQLSAPSIGLRPSTSNTTILQ
jgi:hypothetical protein